MPTTKQLRSRLIRKLKELFQLDQPDLDFGFYRVMHAKAEQVETFLDKDLLKIVADAFGQVDDTRKAQLQAEYEKAIEQAKKYGAPDPEDTDAVKEAKAALDAAKDTVNAEGDIYDHLYRFFERYYDGGDFLSKRYYTRETSGKAAPFAVPYNGEEVKLHWANADQYYIKTAEYFTNYTFDIATGAKLQIETNKKDPKQAEIDFDKYSDMPATLKVHFKIVEASEGEHGNVKASEATKRFFIIHKDNPVEIDENGELIVNFEYRPDPEKGGKQEGSWRQHRNSEATAEILKAVEKLENAGEYARLLSVPAPTESQKDRPLLAKYVNQYTARNTMDYFIHKDLGGFLSRELDFYIKNEVMRLDDIENADAPAVESYLAKIKVLRKIAGKLIEFLAQLEEFQKKLWLKKKFVTETNYCITLDRAPQDLYGEIVANDDQRQEWVKLFAIDEIKAGKGNLLESGAVAYSNLLTVEFLKDNPYLVLDTKFFSNDFKHRLISSIENFDEQCDGFLIHSENFQALNTLQKQYKGQIECVHIDPPYNTATSGFLYKNEYQHSSWMTLMLDRIELASELLVTQGAFQCHIDENEYEALYHIFDTTNLPDAGTIVWDKKNPMLGRKGVATQHEYIVWRGWNDGPIYLKNFNVQKILNKAKSFIENNGGVNETSRKEFAQWITGCDEFTGGEKAYRLIYDDGRVYRGVAMGAPEYRTNQKFHIPLKHPITGKDCPVPPNGWSRAPETLKKLIEAGEILFGQDETTQPQKIVFLTNESKRQISSVIEDTSRGKQDMLGLGTEFPYCHPVSLYETLIGAGMSESGTGLDFFAGSGTTGHAVISLNREDEGNRKYILVEMGDYFDEVTKPRIQKVSYAVQWKDGKPNKIPDYINILKKNIADLKKELKDLKGIEDKTEYDFETQRIKGEIENCQHQIAKAEKQLQEGNDYYGVSHCFKYIRLESYEDTLNNLVFADNHARDKVIAENSSLREDYMLGYLLNTETRGSQSLLNIDAFADPCSYQLTVKKPGTDEYEVRNVDLLETFNYLIGLRVEHIAAPQTFGAKFKREPDPELPEDQNTRLILDSKLKQDDNGPWWFRKVEGRIPADSNNPNNGQKEKLLIVWRKLTGDLEKDNLMLDEWFQKNRISTRDFEFDTIYVNGSNNLPNLKLEGDNWKVRLIEEDFMKNMWDVDSI